MKKHSLIQTIKILILVFLVTSLITSCKKDNDNGSSGAPVITRVRTVSKDSTFKNITTRITLDSSTIADKVKQVAFDSTVTSGRLNGLYAIMGENLGSTTQVLFNGVSAYFNPALVTENSIIITIPTNAPWGSGQPNKLTVVTRNGQFNFDFVIQQPAASITSFTPVAGGAGETVTITGTNFNGVTAVTFDNTPATIIGTPSATQIQVRVPNGIVQAFIYVTTPGGTTRSVGSFGFRYLVYDDALAKGWWVGGWNGGDKPNFSNTSPVKRGTNSIAVTYLGGYAGFQIGNGGGTISLSDKSAVKLSIYGGPGTDGRLVRVMVMGPDKDGKQAITDNEGVVVTLKAGQWTDLTIPLSSFGTRPVILEQLRIQELSGISSPETIYIDDIGFI
ncbi:IPT/TIG domain-containing protein [Mucilaginibacter daejeonensis]|uniref:IPT/TIG domain-containing protein n=1 Tax=Mucilaginibacter daejeonensis TaxID=398049 RepID=UPI001D17BBDD|nr:IPT/TIG domain-containing protein [Mucilaginibacter daejeonensis]UEG51904.1 IPT/TIG domain-containing protein [Mucilaginibacter daejeonensis]